MKKILFVLIAGLVLWAIIVIASADTATPQTGNVPPRVEVQTRQTNDRDCNIILVDMLREIDGLDWWTSMSKAENLAIIRELTRSVGSQGAYLNLCIDEGWENYY